MPAGWPLSIWLSRSSSVHPALRPHVGKGDVQAQIEQVGKNVGACLKASGATVNDIVFTVNHVAEPSEFDKYGDLRVRYFGRPSPQSTTVRTPQ